MNNAFIYKFFFAISLSIFVFIPTAECLAENKQMGEECTNFTCASGDCEKSAVDSSKKYCDCSTPSDCDIFGPKEHYGKWLCKNQNEDLNADGTVNYKNNHGIDYCYNTVTKENVFLIDGSNNPTKAFGGVATNVADVALLNEIKTFKPSNMIKIPNLTFTDVENTIDSEGYIHLPWIGELLKAVYNWGMVVASIVAAIMIILTATKIIMGGGGATAEGYKKIGTIVVGLFIAWGSYAILYNINPALVEFKPLRVKYIETIPLGDYEDLPETAEFGYAEGSGEVNAAAAKSIGGLLGGPNTLPKCSPEAGYDAAKKLNDMQICVGPCHCAWTALRFLSYLGCGNETLTGNANLAVGNLERQGWVSVEIPENVDNLPVGYIMFPGHAGVSIGNGKMFESTIGTPLTNASKADNGTCPGLWPDSKGKPELCNKCAKLLGEEPWNNNYGRPPGNSCQDNQGWWLAKANRIKEFRIVVYPAPANIIRPPLGCCKTKKFSTVASELFCHQMYIKSKGSKKPDNDKYDQKYWDKTITDQNVCSPPPPPKKKK